MKRVLVSALACLLLAAAAGRALVDRREAAGIPVSPSRVPLGGFEPLAVNLLWLRGETLRETGRLTESAAAYRLVTELSPHVAEAWTFPAWMLAWTEARSGNPEREWRWVGRAIDLLRRGLAYNPADREILTTLGLLYYRRLAREPGIYDLARERLGRRPEEAAIEILGLLNEILPELRPGALADSWRLLGEHRLADGDVAGAGAAFRAALPLWDRIATETGSRESERVANEIRARLESLR